MFGLFHRTQPRPSRDRLEHLARTLESLGVSQDDPDLGQEILAHAAEVRARAGGGAMPSPYYRSRSRSAWSVLVVRKCSLNRRFADAWNAQERHRFGVWDMRWKVSPRGAER